MKKMMIALMAVLITVALAGIGTYAYFSDTETSAQNTFTAGTLNFNILDPGGDHKVFNVTNMKPGQTVTGYLVVANDSNMDMKWKAWLSGTVGGTLGEVLKIKWTIHPTGYPSYAVLTGAGYTIAGPVDGPIMNLTAISNLTGPENGNMVWANPGAVAMQPKWAAVYLIEVKMDADAGDVYQGLSYVGDLNFFATQYENPGW
jgi:predicted ribosomally synthesized peptide with SipW-like signal peptide